MTVWMVPPACVNTTGNFICTCPSGFTGVAEQVLELVVQALTSCIEDECNEEYG